MKKTLRETQTLRAGCNKVEPKKNRLAANPLPGGLGRPKFNQLEIVTTFTYRPCLVKIDARHFRVIVETDPQTHTNTQGHRQHRLQYTAPLTLARSINMKKIGKG